jgi:hypothetical protein
MADLTLYMMIILLAILIGFLASLFGIGGGFLLVPTMILFLAMDTHMTVGTVPFIIFFMSLSSTIAYARQKRIDYKITGILLTGSIIGSILGAITTTAVSGKFILVTFGVIESILAIIMAAFKSPQEKQEALKRQLSGVEINQIRTSDEQQATQNLVIQEPVNKWFLIQRQLVDSDGNQYQYQANILLGFPLCFIAGFLSSLVGIGGGTLYIQIFVFLCGMPIHVAIACSMFTIFVSSISGTLTFASLGQINYVVGIVYAIGMVIGAQGGAYVNKRIHSKYLKPMAAAMIFFIAIRMIYFALIQT